MSNSLSAQIYVIGVQKGVDGGLNRVTLGAHVEESDTGLPYSWVSGSIDWGDGSDIYVISPQQSPLNAVSTPVVSVTGPLAYLTLMPSPYTGEFRLYFDDSATILLPYNVTTANLRSAIESVLPQEIKITVSGNSPSWKIEFNSLEAPSRLSAGATTLRAPFVLPDHLYPSGTFVAKLTASNYRSPLKDYQYARVQIDLLDNSNQKSLSPIIIGPILPSDVGYPNKHQWNFNIGTDIKVLISNLKVILNTEPGERLHFPNFGCALAQFIFGQNDSQTEQEVKEEIIRAVGAYEPRVRIEQINTVRKDRSLEVSIYAVSLLDQQRFQLNVELER